MYTIYNHDSRANATALHILELRNSMMAQYLLVCFHCRPYMWMSTVDSCSILLKEKCPWTHSNVIDHYVTQYCFPV